MFFIFIFIKLGVGLIFSSLSIFLLYFYQTHYFSIFIDRIVNFIFFVSRFEPEMKVIPLKLVSINTDGINYDAAFVNSKAKS